MSETSKFSGWRKSSLSGGADNCVEVAFAPDGNVGVRDSKQEGQGPILEFTRTEWEAFLGGVRGGQFDRT